jgi:hypothetical protein
VPHRVPVGQGANLVLQHFLEKQENPWDRIFETPEAVCLAICERVMNELDTSCERDGQELIFGILSSL